MRVWAIRVLVWAISRRLNTYSSVVKDRLIPANSEKYETACLKSHTKNANRMRCERLLPPFFPYTHTHTHTHSRSRSHTHTHTHKLPTARRAYDLQTGVGARDVVTETRAPGGTEPVPGRRGGVVEREFHRRRPRALSVRPGASHWRIPIGPVLVLTPPAPSSQ
jgi:hypothetical protein